MVINQILRKIFEKAFVAYFLIHLFGETAKITETSE